LITPRLPPSRRISEYLVRVYAVKGVVDDRRSWSDEGKGTCIAKMQRSSPDFIAWMVSGKKMPNAGVSAYKFSRDLRTRKADSRNLEEAQLLHIRQVHRAMFFC
jgi:hypothetical protein